VKLVRIEVKLGGIEAKLIVGIKVKLVGIEVKLVRIEEKLIGIEVKLVGIEGKLVGIEVKLFRIAGRLILDVLNYELNLWFSLLICFVFNGLKSVVTILNRGYASALLIMLASGHNCLEDFKTTQFSIHNKPVKPEFVEAIRANLYV
jgi:hypothetical protein